MFDSRTTQLASSYQQFVENSLLNFRKIGKAIEELIKAIQEKVKDKKEELSAIDVQVGSEKYRLVPDEECPGAWKWESAQMTDFQEQTVLRRLVTESAVNPEVQADIRDVERDSSLAVVAHTQSGESIVVYHQDSKGSCHTNIVTTNLEEEEIIDAVNEVHYPLSETTTDNKLRPPADVVEEINDKVNIEGEAVESNTSLQDEIVPLKEDYALQNSGSPLPQPPFFEEEAVVFWDEDALIEPPVEDYPPDWEEGSVKFLDKDALIPKPSRLGEKTVGLANQDAPILLQEEELSALDEGKVDKTEPVLQDFSAFDIPTPTPAAAQKRINTQSTETENTPPKKRSPQESQFNTDTEILSRPRQKPAAEYSYEQIGDSDEVSPETKRWVRVVEVPVSKAVANSRAEGDRIKGENIKIVQTAMEMVKAYGEETGYGYKVYRSDAFVIKLEGEKYSIHHRRDELNQFGNPLMQFSLNSKGNAKIEVPPTQMLPVERQEFLMVGERLESGKKLPRLAMSIDKPLRVYADLRDVANNLGSLAPAGTFKTLESFRETEMLGLLNSALQKANTDTLTVGEYTISRTRDVEAGRANLSLHKTASSGERTELLSFTLQKTAEGLSKRVDKLSISDWDLTQLKFISENAKAFDLGHTLGNSRGQQQPQESVSEIKVPLHPAIQKAWNQLETEGDPNSYSSVTQENERIRQNLQEFGGKLSIGEQRELYFQVLAQQRLDSSIEQIKMPPLKEIMQDLEQLRKAAISERYTPSEQIPFAPEKTAARSTAATKSKTQLSL